MIEQYFFNVYQDISLCIGKHPRISRSEQDEEATERGPERAYAREDRSEGADEVMRSLSKAV